VGAAQFQVTDQGAQSMTGPLQVLGLSLNNSGGNDTRLAYHYLRSADLLAKLEGDLSLKEHYQQRSLDIFSRLRGSATAENFLDYYQAHLRTSFDDAAGLVTFEVDGFTPEFAKRLAEDMLARSEDYLNDVGHQLARERLSFYQDELRRDTAKLEESKAAMIAFQNDHGMLDPMAEAGARTATVLKLQDALAEQRANLAALLSDHGPTAQEVVVIKSRIEGLEALVHDERARIIGVGAAAKNPAPEDKAHINAVAAQWSALELDVDFATQLVKVSTTSLEQAQTEVGQKIKSLVVVSRPTLAQEAEYPRVWYNTITLFIVCGLLFGTGSMILATIREHRD
jgi:capsular polysaccharide transport system permease protein